jgi:hypothetical protein
MKYMVLIFLFSIVSLGQAQNSNAGEELKTLSKEFKVTTPAEEGKYVESLDFDLMNDTLYIYHSKGFPESGSVDEYHYFMKLNELENVEFKEMTMGDLTMGMLSFTAKNNEPKLIFKYGTKEEVFFSLKNDPFSEEEIQSYSVITLPDIKDKSKYKKLESQIKTLIK